MSLYHYSIQLKTTHSTTTTQSRTTNHVCVLIIVRVFRIQVNSPLMVVLHLAVSLAGNDKPSAVQWSQ